MRLTEEELVRGYQGTATEDELLIAVTDALTLCGWRWMHVRRSDLAVVMGSQGWPDVVALRGGLGLALELKSTAGRPTGEQVAWLRELRAAGLSALVIRPDDLDDLLRVIVGRDGWEATLAELQARTLAGRASDA